MAGMNLGKQYGPLPLGGWVAVIIGGLGIGYFINRSQGSGSTAEPETPVGEESGAGGGQFIYQPPATGEQPGAVTDNLTWAKKAKDYLSALPGVDAVQAANAIERYLSGMSLSKAERALVNLAITQFGNPPEGVTPVDDTPPTTPPVTPPVKPEEVAVLTVLVAPTAGRRNVAVGFSGTARSNNRPGQYLIEVQRRKPGSSVWLAHTWDASNRSGNWGVNTAFGSAGTWGIRFRIRQIRATSPWVTKSIRIT